MTLQPETMAEIAKLSRNTVAEASMRFGVNHSEPLLVAMDAMLRYAKAYQTAYDSRIGDDGVLGEEFESVIRGVRGLLNGQGGAAMEYDRSTDSKDNGTIEALYWITCDVAGIDGN